MIKWNYQKKYTDEGRELSFRINTDIKKANAMSLDILRNHTFPPSSEQDWIEAVERSLKGKGIDSLRKDTYENITLKPLYSERTQELGQPGTAPYTRGIGKNEFWICQENRGENAEIVKEAVVKGIECGENTISFKADSLQPEEVKELLADLPIEDYPIFIQANAAQQAIMEGNQAFRGAVTRDLMMEWVQAGGLPLNEQAELADWFSFIDKWRQNKPEVKTVLVDTVPYHEAGADAAREIAYALAAGVEYMNAAKSNGMEPVDLAESMIFSFAIDSQFFMQIGKLRAARRLWSAVGQAYGIQGCKMAIHAKTSMRNKSSYDRHVNLLRTSNEAFAALAGGCQYITVVPFDAMLTEGSSLGIRMARNIVHILDKEAGVRQTEDPGGGSYYLEELTDELCEKAWIHFLELERGGGMLAGLRKGRIQAEISELARIRLENVSLRKEKIIGVNVYANPSEGRSDVRVQLPSASGAEKRKEIIPLKPISLSSEFEVIRSMNLTWQDKGLRERIALACIGDLKAYKPYMDFAKEIMAAGGLSYQLAEGLRNLKDIEEFASQPTTIHLIICGNEEDLQGELSALSLDPQIRIYTVGEFQESAKYKQIDRSVDIIEWLTVLSSTQEVEA